MAIYIRYGETNECDQPISVPQEGSHITKGGVIALDNDLEILVGKVTRTLTPLTESINSDPRIKRSHRTHT